MGAIGNVGSTNNADGSLDTDGNNTFYVNSERDMIIKAKTTMTLTCPETTITGELTIEDKLLFTTNGIQQAQTQAFTDERADAVDSIMSATAFTPGTDETLITLKTGFQSAAYTIELGSITLQATGLYCVVVSGTFNNNNSQNGYVYSLLCGVQYTEYIETGHTTINQTTAMFSTLGIQNVQYISHDQAGGDKLVKMSGSYNIYAPTSGNSTVKFSYTVHKIN